MNNFQNHIPPNNPIKQMAKAMSSYIKQCECHIPDHPRIFPNAKIWIPCSRSHRDSSPKTSSATANSAGPSCVYYWLKQNQGVKPFKGTSFIPSQNHLWIHHHKPELIKSQNLLLLFKLEWTSCILQMGFSFYAKFQKLENNKTKRR